MATARQQERWDHTASLLALLANLHRDARRRKAYAPADFHPLRQAARPTPMPNLSILKAVFVDRSHPPEAR